MDKIMQWIIGLIIILVLGVAVPVGIAVATDWSPQQTNAAMSGVFAICGGSVALAALGFGVAAGIGTARAARTDEPRDARTRVIPTGDWQLDELKRQRAAVDLERAILAAERDRRALLPEPPSAPERDPVETWLAQMPAWEFVDTVQQQ